MQNLHLLSSLPPFTESCRESKKQQTAIHQIEKISVRYFHSPPSLLDTCGVDSLKGRDRKSNLMYIIFCMRYAAGLIAADLF